MFLTPTGLNNKAQGRRRRTLGLEHAAPARTPTGFHTRSRVVVLTANRLSRVWNPVEVRAGQRKPEGVAFHGFLPRVRCATLGFALQRLRRKEVQPIDVKATNAVGFVTTLLAAVIEGAWESPRSGRLPGAWTHQFDVLSLESLNRWFRPRITSSVRSLRGSA